MEQLRVGVPLPWDVHDGAGQLLLRRGYVIERGSQLESLVARGMYVAAEALKAAKPATAAPAEQRFDPFWLWQDLMNKTDNQSAPCVWVLHFPTAEPFPASHNCQANVIRCANSA